MTTQAFTSTAAFYALFSDSAARIDRERPLLLDLLHAAPGHRVADIACGTGFHAAMFADAGAVVDAFDISHDMIGQARTSHPHERITYHTLDMRELDGGSWDLIVCLGNSLSLLADEMDLKRTFLGISNCLVDGGYFITQTINYDRSAAKEPRHNIRSAILDGRDVLAVKNLVPHNGRTFLSLTFFIDNAGTVTSMTDTALLRHLTLENLSTAAQDAGLMLESSYGNFSRAVYDPDSSPDLICVLRKSPRV